MNVSIETLVNLVTLAGIVGGATWALRSKLSAIEVAIKGHISKDEEVHREQTARIIKLEKRRASR